MDSGGRCPDGSLVSSVASRAIGGFARRVAEAVEDASGHPQHRPADQNQQTMPNGDPARPSVAALSSIQPLPS